MNVRNRMADVIKLRCNACQDFLKLLLNDNWQQELYELAQKEVTNNTFQKNRYIAAYEKMRDIGFENYTVDDMDVTFISTIVDANNCNKFKAMNSVHDNTRKSLMQLRDDRNLTNHSDENEEPDELYLRGLLALCNLKNFVRTVDKYELSIEDEKRQSYRQQYITGIDSLEEKLDEERIELIQWKKEMNRDIRKIKESNNQSYEFGRVCNHYFDRYIKFEKTDQSYEKYNYFIIQASNCGIEGAHSLAVMHFIIEKDYSEAERRLFMWYSSKKEFHINDVQEIVRDINHLINLKYKLTNSLQEIIDGLISKGFKITKTSKGLFEIDAK